MKTTTVDSAERGRSPLGAHTRLLMDGPHGNMIHSTVPPGMVGRACRFRTIDEYWYVLSGEGELWRRAEDGQESVTRLVPGTCVDIPLGTAFQYRCIGVVPLVFTCTALPPWPGDDEAVIVTGPWTPQVDVSPDESTARSGDAQAGASIRAQQPAAGSDGGPQAGTPTVSPGGGPAAVPFPSVLLARSAALEPPVDTGGEGESAFAWAASVTRTEVLQLGAALDEMINAGAPTDLRRAFGIAWRGGARIPRREETALIGQFAELHITVAGVLAGRDLRATEVPQRPRGLSSFFDFRSSRPRQAESAAGAVIDQHGDLAQYGLLAMWNAWMAVRLRERIPRPLFESLVQPWVTVVGPLPEA